jgi:hypothetical protein
MIMAKSVIEEHQRLYHYTTAIGLDGILKSQQLWATHISYLNDHEEHTGFFDRRLPLLLKEPVQSALAEIGNTIDGRKIIDEEGGAEKVAADLIRDLSTNIRNSSLSFNQPYVASFCRELQGKTSGNGLLSQWRGYGPDGGYAIVFDTLGFEKLLEDEARKFHYQLIHWGDVDYFDDGQDINASHPETREWEETLQGAIKQFILTQQPEAFDPMHLALSQLSCRHKHIGFSEESEVRIIAFPPNAELLAVARSSGDNRPTKPIRFTPRGGLLVPYIALFEHSAGEEQIKLPITKIIVGPHPEKLKRQKAVELLLEQLEIPAEVVVSDIPYVGR